MLAGSEYLKTVFAAERPTSIVDVGANPIDGDPPYLEMLRAGLCTVAGFEPQALALALGVVVLAIGAEHVTSAIAARERLRKTSAVAAIVAVLCGIALVVPHVPISTTAPKWSNDTTATLESIPSGSVVLTYPSSVPPWNEAMVWQAIDRMWFRQIGGYATVQGGSDYGVVTPPLLPPDFVQEDFMAAQNGASTYYPAPPTNVESAEQLCSFLSTYNVGAVVYWYAGSNPADVLQLLVNTLGKPDFSTSDGSLVVWLTTPGRCSAT